MYNGFPCGVLTGSCLRRTEQEHIQGTVPITHKSPPPLEASKNLVDAVRTRLDAFFKSSKRVYKLDASRFLMDADAVQTGSVQRLQRTRPATLVDASSKNDGQKFLPILAHYLHVLKYSRN